MLFPSCAVHGNRPHQTVSGKHRGCIRICCAAAEAKNSDIVIARTLFCERRMRALAEAWSKTMLSACFKEHLGLGKVTSV